MYLQQECDVGIVTAPQSAFISWQHCSSEVVISGEKQAASGCNAKSDATTTTTTLEDQRINSH
ncbi:MAG: hypothetical protein ABIP81_08805 [Terriglobales bacterium]